MSQPTEEFIHETQELWNQKAQFWDELMGEDGNKFYKWLVSPTAERLLGVQPGEVVLDLACGNGVFARRLAQLGATVVATDFSAGLIERAQARGQEYANRIEYRQVDATSEEQLLALGKRRFDAVVCNMAFMDIPTIDPLLRAAGRLLKETGRFVFTLTHPCFNSTSTKLGMEQEDRDGLLIETYSVKISEYLNPITKKGAGAPGEPNPHYYFDRPLNAILQSCFAAGFVVDGLEEPAFGPEVSFNRPLSWGNLKNIPPVLAVRLRAARPLVPPSRQGD